jgi:nucleoside-diphosphate-sugar epimerase
MTGDPTEGPVSHRQPNPASAPAPNRLARDLDHVFQHTRGLWEELRGARIFITGGTGFFGCWLLDSFCWANDLLGLEARAVVLTRNPQAFSRKAPHLAGHPAVELLEGDVRTFRQPSGEFPFVIHAATEASLSQLREAPLEMLSTILDGTRRTLEFARSCGARKFLLASSGAVYGGQPPELTHVSEQYCGAPSPVEARSAYGEGKRCAELMCSLYASPRSLECKIARCFAFVGPHLPLDIHYAVGNFIRDALRGGPVRVAGDGTPYRSYLYAADLAIWLWTILFRGRSLVPYNVGSERDLTIASLARQVAEALSPGVQVEIARDAVPGLPPERYVPSTQSARDELGLREHVDLQDAIRRTARWHGWNGVAP